MTAKAARHLGLVEDGRCGEPTKSGAPCRRRSLGGGPCRQHGGVASASASSAGEWDPPSYLGEVGRRCWNDYVARFRSAGRLSRLDRQVLEQAAVSAEGAALHWEAIVKYGALVKGRGEEIKSNPASAKHTAYQERFDKFTKVLGRLLGKPNALDDDLTPSPAGADDLASLL